jgi:hypothetical protein
MPPRPEPEPEPEEEYVHIVDAQVQEAVRNASTVWVKELATSLLVKTLQDPNSAQEIAQQARQARQAQAAGGLAELLVPGVRVKALASGGSLPRNGEDVAWNRAVLIEAGAVQPLAQLLASPAKDVQFAAAAAISALSHDAEGVRQIAEAGAVGHLVRLLAVDSHDAQLSALSALRTLGCDHLQRQAIRQEGGIAHFVRLLESSSTVMQEAALSALWQLAFDSLGDQNRLAMQAAGCVPRVLKLLRSDDEEVRSSAETLLDLLGLEVDTALAEHNAQEEARLAMVQADYDSLDAHKRLKEQRSEEQQWRLDKVKKKKAEAAQKEAEKQEATRRMHGAF